MIIPHTWQRTQLSQLQLGDSVNVEYDVMAKMVARQLQCGLSNDNQKVVSSGVINE